MHCGACYKEDAAVQVELVAAQYEQLSFGKAIDAIQKVSARGNLFLQEREPWAAFKKVCLCTKPSRRPRSESASLHLSNVSSLGHTVVIISLCHVCVF